MSVEGTASTVVGRPSHARAGSHHTDGTWVYVLAACGVVLGVAVLMFKLRDGTHPLATTVVGCVGGMEFVGTGVLAHYRRPANRVGSLMVAVGIGLFAEDMQLSRTSWVYSAGFLLTMASSGFAAHLVLAFPTGALASRGERALAGAGYAVVFGLPLVRTLFYAPPARYGVRSNLLMVTDNRAWSDALQQAEEVTGAAVALAVTAVLVRRWMTAGPPLRRVLAPVFVTGLVGGGVTVLDGVLDLPHPVRQVLLWVYMAVFCLLPLGFLAGVLRVRLGRTAVGDLLAGLTEPRPAAELRGALARALGDPSLQVAYWHADADEFVDADGAVVALPGPDQARDVRLVERDGRRVAALVHDPALREDPHILDAVTAAAGLALDNQRLAAEVRAQLAEVRASRLRIVAAADTERRRLERDLHDGAQQRLVAATLTLRLLQRHLDGKIDPDAAGLLASGTAGLDAAMAELRELARGIHPAILTDAGLLPAVAELAARAPAPVDVDAAPTDLPRLDAAVEATGYFVVAEALTNAFKHAGAEQIRVTIEHEDDQLRVGIVDNGLGGADLAGGTGLRGLRDRITALNGQLTVRSAPGEGTSITAVIPAPGRR
ncbi:sensor histidine kinase [Frankia sp. CiP3]|uniref:sensor histidine kinase n=1 Tax=Frankia sp. CiP3 TaxID=2880971 RepID=UPI001EF55C60|nr:sensor histidine kinase [Frankia sp. CiP3]